MAGVDVDDLEEREELAHERQHLVGDVPAPGAPDEKRPPREPGPGRVLVGEVAHAVERPAEYVEGHAELLGLLALGRVEVGQEEHPDGEGLFGLDFGRGVSMGG